jgi:hypothetical protein
MSRLEQEATLETVKQLLSIGRTSIYSVPLYYNSCISKEKEIVDTLVNKITQPDSKNSVCSNERKMIETNYDTFIKSVYIVHNDSIDNFNDALGLLVEKEKSVSYYTKTILKLCNVNFMEVDKNGSYIYDYKINRQVDIIDNITFTSNNKNVKIIFDIGGRLYDNVNTLLMLLSSYTEIKLRFYFTENPKNGDEISLSYRNYLLNSKERNELQKYNVVLTDTNKYYNGMCLPK